MLMGLSMFLFVIVNTKCLAGQKPSQAQTIMLLF